MPLLLLLVTLTTELLGSWTLAYHLAMLLGLSPRQTGIVFLGILLPALILSRRYWARAIHCSRGERRFAAGVVCLGCAFALFALCVYNYNADDYGFYHRALVQLRFPDQPFRLTEAGLLPQGFPLASMLHAMSSYEMAVAFTAHLLGADPLWSYQNGVGFLNVVLLSVGAALLHRQFRVGAKMALLATFASMLFLVVDARESRSFGDLLWYGSNGKVLLFGVLLPWTVLLALRCLRRPLWSRFLPLVLAGVCATGLSGSGLFLFPAELFLVSIAYLFQSRPSWRRFRRAVLLNTASVYCTTIVAAALVGVIPKPANTDIWMQGWPGEWWRNLGLVWATPQLVVRDALLVFVLPLFALRRSYARLACSVGVTWLVVVANPLVGPLWIRVVAPGAYWRFVFLLPMAWYAGLIVPALFARHKRLAADHEYMVPVAGRTVAVLAILAMAIAWRSLDPSRRAPTAWRFKSPQELRLPRPEAEFARLAIPHLQGRHILGPEHACICIALLAPGTSGFEAVRSTEHFLVNAGLPEEGRLRVLAQKAVTEGDAQGDRTAELTASLRKSFDRGVDAVIFVDSEPVRRLVVPQLADRSSAAWRRCVAGCGYALYLREASGADGRERSQ